MHIFLDMDNVSYDFNGGVKNLTGKSYDELTENERLDFWHYSFTPDFFEKLDPDPDLNECIDLLYENFSSVRFLTALPFHRKDLAHQCMSAKLECVRNTLDAPTPVTFGPFAIDKQNHCIDNNFVLIDDSVKNLKQWASKGGYSWHHKEFGDLSGSVTRLVNEFKAANLI